MLIKIAHVHLQMIEDNMFYFTSQRQIAVLIERRDQLEEFIFGNGPAPEFLFGN